MAEKISELSVFLPIYNESEVIRSVVIETYKVLQKIAIRWELLLINDGSTDESGKIIDNLQRQYAGIRVINHRANQGYGASIKSGLYSAKYEWIAFTDSDGQFDFSEIENFISKQKETKADVVIGYYKKRQVSKFKIVTSKIWEFAIFVLFGLKVRDVDCGFKFISKKVIEDIPKLESERGAFISSEFLIKARKAGYKIVEIPVTHYPRLKGMGTGRKLNVIIKSFIDLFKLWKKLL